MFSPQAANSFQRAFRITQVFLNRSGGDNVEMRQRQLAADDAADDVTPIAQRMIADNYAKSGLQTQTGTLLEAVKKSRVIARVIDNKAMKLVVMMPQQPQTHKDQNAQEFYAMAGALEFGAVRYPKSQKKWRPTIDAVTGAITGYKFTDPVGRKTKATIKKYAMTGTMSKKARTRMEQGITISGKYYEGYDLGSTYWTNLNKDFKRKSVKFSGGVVVTQPHPFFKLSPSQMRELGKQFAAAFIEAYTQIDEFSKRR